MNGLPAVLDARGLELVGHSDLDGRGDGMQVMRNGDVLYVGHMGDFGVGTSVVDISDLTRPRVVAQLPAPRRAHAHKTQYADGLLLVNHERYPYDVTDPNRTDSDACLLCGSAWGADNKSTTGSQAALGPLQAKVQAALNRHEPVTLTIS